MDSVLLNLTLVPASYEVIGLGLTGMSTTGVAGFVGRWMGSSSSYSALLTRNFEANLRLYSRIGAQMSGAVLYYFRVYFLSFCNSAIQLPKEILRLMEAVLLLKNA